MSAFEITVAVIIGVLFVIAAVTILVRRLKKSVGCDCCNCDCVSCKKSKKFASKASLHDGASNSEN